VAFYLSGMLFSGNKKEKLERITHHTSMMVEKLNSVWKEGELDIVSKKETAECKSLLNYKNQVSGEFFQCNPLYLNCYLSDFNFKGFRPLRFKKRFFEYDHLGNLVVTLNKQDSYFRLKLLNTCRDVFLPKKKYSAGPKKIQTYVWDNLNELVYIDKYYVTNLDIIEWKKRAGKKINEKELKRAPFEPNTYLNKDEMTQFCFSQNKKVLESRYFDAASYIPNKNDNPKIVKKFPYHWTKRRTVESKDCFNVYAKGCESKRDFKFFEGLSTSWMGIHYVLGGYMEYLPSKFDGEKDIKVSSFYFDEQSKWHQIGIRGKLGKDNSTRSQQDIGVAFRCMALR
tara:strand:+ start:124 stop:1143 length:1020 start_codon:yes stop_codon:yes gene_type:complete